MVDSFTWVMVVSTFEPEVSMSALVVSILIWDVSLSAMDVWIFCAGEFHVVR